MKRFNYKARDKATGKVVKGSIQADTEQNAGRLLLEQGFIPSYIKEDVNEALFKSSRVRSDYVYASARHFDWCRPSAIGLASYSNRANRKQRYENYCRGNYCRS